MRGPERQTALFDTGVGAPDLCPGLFRACGHMDPDENELKFSEAAPQPSIYTILGKETVESTSGEIRLHKIRHFVAPAGVGFCVSRTGLS